MKSKSIITSASNKFFPSLLNLIGSIKQNYPDHPPIFIYDLGMSNLFLNYLKQINKVTILNIPAFCEHWRSCYTWKSYCLNKPLSDLNLYIDAGNVVLKNLGELFDKIDKTGYLLVDQGEVLLDNVCPQDYFNLYDIEENSYIKKSKVIAAGIFGFKKDDGQIGFITRKLFDASKSGLCIGFSKNEQWKNKGVNKNFFIRECERFRHDTTLLSLIVYKYMENPSIEKIDLFKGELTGNSDQFLWNVRMNYNKLKYTEFVISKHKSITISIFLLSFIALKHLNHVVKFKLMKNR